MTIAEVLGLLIAVVVVATIADRLRIAYPILLVIAGLVVAILPVAHRVTLQPDLILLVLLPPLIYDASLWTRRPGSCAPTGGRSCCWPWAWCWPP
jgi:NhaP-type Na+/H+ or K+/H+ antiporter